MMLVCTRVQCVRETVVCCSTKSANRTRIDYVAQLSVEKKRAFLCFVCVTSRRVTQFANGHTPVIGMLLDSLSLSSWETYLTTNGWCMCNWE
jgi:hypothetical protein